MAKNYQTKIKNLIFQKNRIKLFKIRSKDPENIFNIAFLKTSSGITIVVGKLSEGIDEVLENFLNIFLALVIPIFLISLIGGFILTQKLFYPFKHVISTMSSITESNDISIRMQIRSNYPKEFRELILIFNLMLDKIEKLIKGMKDSLDYVAHDLKTPITRLINRIHTVLANESSDIEKCKEVLVKNIEECEIIVNMLDSVMTLSEAEAGAINLKIEQIDIKKIFEKIIEVYEYIAQEKDITINLNSFGNTDVLGDKNLIARVIANLLDNAIKYTDKNGIINCSVYENKDFVVFSIEDNGIGLEEKDIDKIFQRLYRADKGRLTKGYGLGLSIVKAVIEAHKGEISVISEKGRGSTFIVKLPIKPYAG